MNVMTLLIRVKRGKWLILAAIALTMVAILAGHTSAQGRPVTNLPGEAVPIMASIRHIPYVGAAHEPYNSVPPTSGPHLPWTVAPGVYQEPIAEELQVHALEHGHILIQYAPGLAKEQIDQLEGIARRYPRDVVMAPYTKLIAGIALTAWGRVERVDQANLPRIEFFIQAFAGRYNHGPQD
jgi:hypothetical protein